ncbi:MAG: hypothetical protein ACJ77K_17510 [Bacteroidia bacterium]
MRFVFRHIILLSLLFSGVCLSAQTDAKKDKIDALRADFLKKKLNLSAKESDAFWPLYNEMNDKLEAARKTFRNQYNDKTNYDFASDKEAEAYLNAQLVLKQKEYELYKEYYDKFKKILPVKKVAALQRGEEEFKKKLVEIVKANGG